MTTAALEAPAAVTVHHPRWKTAGRVIGRAPYSLRVEWTHPTGETRRAWFAYDPSYSRHGRMHGDSTEDALRIEVA